MHIAFRTSSRKLARQGKAGAEARPAWHRGTTELKIALVRHIDSFHVQITPRSYSELAGSRAGFGGLRRRGWLSEVRVVHNSDARRQLAPSRDRAAAFIPNSLRPRQQSFISSDAWNVEKMHYKRVRRQCCSAVPHNVPALLGSVSSLPVFASYKHQPTASSRAFQRMKTHCRLGCGIRNSGIEHPR